MHLVYANVNYIERAIIPGFPCHPSSPPCPPSTRIQFRKVEVNVESKKNQRNEF